MPKINRKQGGKMIRLESTYLIKDLPKTIDQNDHEEIEQGYFVESDDAMRLRRKGAEYSLTKKLMPFPNDKGIREYNSFLIGQKEYEKFWPLTINRLNKTRYYFDGFAAEVRVDVFHGDLEGLVLGEVVFGDEDIKRNFKKPAWFGNEVTQIISNQFLAGNKFNELKKELDQLSK
jgi:CYTH domain-containing protein